MANEKRLIDANELVNHIDCCVGESKDLISSVCIAIKCYVEQMPTVDAVEVVHGYWIDSRTVDHMGRITEHSIDCSVCNSVFKDKSREVVKHWKERFKVCPFCGAVMDGDGNG